MSALGYQVTFGQHVLVMDQFNSSPIEARIADLHAAFIDDNVKAILAVTGGYNSNELLPDWTVNHGQCDRGIVTNRRRLI
ncbi:hypothetical protein A4W77_03440 [Latilactobacillus curvatus]|nr:hypothetical protein A4W77_03440 [Latilactobacillus curvatus]